MEIVARRLAQLALDIRFTKLPAPVINESKRRLLDALGCAFGGFHGAPSVVMRDLAADLGGKPEATVLGTNHRTASDRAALVNGTMLRYLDFMDSHAGADACHPCFNIPPCLAVAERVGASGQDLIAAIVAGYEIQIRFQESCKIGARGWFSGTYLEFSVPLAVGKLLGLDIERMTHALAIAATHANALTVNSGSIPASKSIADGMVASTAILGALMAGSGLTGPTAILDHAGMFETAVAGVIDYERLLAPLADCKLMEVNTKFFNTVRTAQTAVTGMFSLLEAHRLDWRDVEAVTLFLPTREHVGHDGIWNSPARLRPQNRDSANHSLVYSLAVAMVDGELGPEQYADAKLHDPAVLSLIDRTSLQADATLDRHWPEAAASRVVLRTKNGASHEATTLYPPGHHKNRLSDEQMRQKFTKLTAPVLGKAQQAAIIDSVERLDTLESVDQLTVHLTGR